MKLSTVFELEEKICAARDELARLKSLATAITPKLDGLPKAKSLSSRVENLAVKIMDCERRLDELVEEKICAQLDLSSELAEQLTDNILSVMALRYVHGKTFAEIGRLIHYSRKQVWLFHQRGRALFKDKDS